MTDDKTFFFTEGTLINELSSLEQKKIKQVRVNDLSITQNKSNLIRFVKKIDELAADILFLFELDFSIIDKDVVEALSSIYCSLDIKIPDDFCTDQQLDSAKMKNISKKCNLLNEVGLVFGFVVCNTTSVKSFKLLLDFMFMQYPNHIQFELQNLKPTNILSTQDIKKLENLAFAVLTFYTYGRSVPWFIPVVSALKIKPSVFISDFAEWQRCNNCSLASKINLESAKHSEIEKMLLSFTKFKYEEKKLFHSFPAVEDLIKLHGAFSRAYADNEKTCLDLSYSPDDLFSSFSQNILLFAEQTIMEACSVEVFPSEDGADLKYLK